MKLLSHVIEKIQYRKSFSYRMCSLTRPRCAIRIRLSIDATHTMVGGGLPPTLLHITGTMEPSGTICRSSSASIGRPGGSVTTSRSINITMFYLILINKIKTFLVNYIRYSSFDKYLLDTVKLVCMVTKKKRTMSMI